MTHQRINQNGRLNASMVLSVAGRIHALIGSMEGAGLPLPSAGPGPLADGVVRRLGTSSLEAFFGLTADNSVQALSIDGPSLAGTLEEIEASIRQIDDEIDRSEAALREHRQDLKEIGPTRARMAVEERKLSARALKARQNFSQTRTDAMERLTALQVDVERLKQRAGQLQAAIEKNGSHNPSARTALKKDKAVAVAAYHEKRAEWEQGRAELKARRDAVRSLVEAAADRTSRLKAAGSEERRLAEGIREIGERRQELLVQREALEKRRKRCPSSWKAEGTDPAP
jgi:chromosome segregation ATPase